MLKSQYVFEYIRAALSLNRWERRHFAQFYPSAPSLIYKAVEGSGFSPAGYRDLWPDLKAELKSEALSVKHYIHYRDHEVKAPRRFAIALDFDRVRDLTEIPVQDRSALGSVVRILVQSQVDFSAAATASPSFWSDALQALSKVGTPVIAIGDSHSLVLRQTIRADTGPILSINLLCGGGSAMGLANPNSRSGYGPMIVKAMAALDEAKTVLGLATPVFFTFGQVDTEFVFTYRRLRNRDFTYNEDDFDAFCKDAAYRYVGWLASLKSPNVVVVGINPPCIDDAYIKEAYLAQMQVYLHAGVADVKDGDSFDSLVPIFNQLEFPSKAIRTRNHRLYNANLRSAAQELGLRYTDAFDPMMGQDGCIDPRFACASDGRKLQVGLTGKDIHVGGKHALAAKGDMIRRFVEHAPR